MIGRREGCDIVLKFANVSGQHCRMTVEHGYWFVRDLGSRNGTKVDGQAVVRKRLDPKCRIAFAKHEYKLVYEPQDWVPSGLRRQMTITSMRCSSDRSPSVRDSIDAATPIHRRTATSQICRPLCHDSLITFSLPCRRQPNED